MKIAIHSCLFSSGESSTAQSFIAAGRNKGFNVKEFYKCQEIEAFEPDFVINFNYLFPKLTRFATYCCVAGPLEHITEEGREYAKYILTFDGYVAPLGSGVYDFASDLCFSMNKAYPGVYYSGHYAPDFDFPLANLSNPNLIYCGHNWDQRYLNLLELLSAHDWFNVYGSPNGWKDIQVNYKGEISYDESSLLQVYRKAGVGLSLQSKGHVDYNIASNRIYEITAAGAIAIVERMPFVEEHFGDSVLYIDHTKSDKEIYKDVVAHMDWIRNNPNEAAAKAHRANQITRDKFSAEQMLDRFVKYHQESMKFGGWSLSIPKESQPEVAVIVRAGGRSIEMLRRSFDSLRNQIYKNIRPILVLYKKLDYLEEFLQEYRSYFSQIDIVECFDGIRSTTLWAGLNYVYNQKIPYFCILDDDDEFFPNHISNLFETLQRNRREGGVAQWAYSMWFIEDRNNEFTYSSIKENRAYQHYSAFKKTVRDQIGSLLPISVLIKTSLLDKKILQDPFMRTWEDSYLWQLLFSKNLPIPSFFVTAIQHLHGENSSFQIDSYRAFDQLKLKTRFLGQREPGGSFWETDINIEMSSINKVCDNQIAESILNRFSIKRLLLIFIRVLKIFKKLIFKSPILLKRILLKIEKL